MMEWLDGWISPLCFWIFFFLHCNLIAGPLVASSGTGFIEWGNWMGLIGWKGVSWTVIGCCWLLGLLSGWGWGCETEAWAVRMRLGLWGWGLRPFGLLLRLFFFQWQKTEHAPHNPFAFVSLFWLSGALDIYGLLFFSPLLFFSIFLLQVIWFSRSPKTLQLLRICGGWRRKKNFGWKKKEILVFWRKKGKAFDPLFDFFILFHSNPS